MFCKNCGKEVHEADTYCSRCGVSLNESAHTNRADQPSYDFRNTNSVPSGRYMPKSKWVTFFLCFFLGGIGAHRFYVGKIGTGILYLFTLGLFGIGSLVDLIVILCDAFEDSEGYALI